MRGRPCGGGGSRDRRALMVQLVHQAMARGGRPPTSDTDTQTHKCIKITRSAAFADIHFSRSLFSHFHHLRTGRTRPFIQKTVFKNCMNIYGSRSLIHITPLLTPAAVFVPTSTAKPNRAHTSAPHTHSSTYAAYANSQDSGERVANNESSSHYCRDMNGQEGGNRISRFHNPVLLLYCHPP